MKLVGWEKFLEAKKTGEMPPLNGKKAPDFGPHAKNDGKTILRVAEKNKDDALGDKASPVMKNAKDCCSAIPLRLRGLGIGEMNSAGRRLGIVFWVGCP